VTEHLQAIAANNLLLCMSSSSAAAFCNHSKYCYLQSALDHPVQRVASTTAHTNDLDACLTCKAVGQ
jgi:hypothetical protein